MKIERLVLTEGISQSDDIFSDKTNLVFSKYNSKGKSTYFRLLFYALGYAIPQMKGINFPEINTEIYIVVKEKRYVIIREISILKVIDTDTGEINYFSLPHEHVSFLSFILDYDKIKVLKNLLGIMYIDQDKGWTLLNRGTVIGKLKFSIEELIAGLNNIDCDELLVKKGKLTDEENKLKTALNIIKLKEELQEKSGEVVISDMENMLNANLALISLKISDIKRSIQEIDKVINKDESFFDYINSMNLFVEENGIIISVNKNTLKNSVHTLGLQKARRSLLLTELYQHEREHIKAKIKLDDYLIKNNIITNLLEDTADVKMSRQLAAIELDQDTINNLLDRTQKELKIVKKQIKKKLKDNNHYIVRVYEYVSRFAKKLGISDKMQHKADFIFTSDIKSMSGAILLKMVFCFKAAFLKIIEEDIGENLFMVLDSPRSKELDDVNAKAVFQIVSDDLKDTQTFIASIFDFDCENRIELIERAIENRNITQ